MHRRDVLAGAVGAVVAGSTIARGAEPVVTPRDRVAKGRLKQSVCRWCYSGMELEALCVKAKEIGLASVELLGENEWAVPSKHGLACAVGNGPTTIAKGYNRVDHHDRFVKELERLIPKAAEMGVPSLIVFSGNRDGMDDATGLENCAIGLTRSTALAERHGVTLVMELLNSRVDHGDYMCDRTPWGAKLVDKVGSPRFKLLYDIYHMQIMEGDIIRTIRDNAARIGHYHTAGVPGRREIDGTQELWYPAICKAIADSGFTGYLGQEFIPSGDAMGALADAAQVCAV
jgi:hydroxypyruvate isomerase